MIQRLFTSESRSVTAAALIIGAASLASRLLGMLRDRVLAGEFGAGRDLDMYYAAFRIPDTLYNVLIVGALSAGFIPVFISLLERRQQAWRLVNGLLMVILISLGGLSAVLFFLAPWLTPFLTPGFTPEQQRLTASLSQIMFLSPVFLGISGILSGVLQSLRRFFIFSIAPILYNVGIILGALFLAPRWGLIGLAWGVVGGAFLHMLIQLPAVMNAGYRFQLTLDLKMAEIKTIFVLMVPRTLGLVISQLNLFIITVIGSTLAAGSITIFNFANNLQSFPLGIFAVSLAIAAFPSLSAAARNPKGFVTIFAGAARQILFFILPSTVLLIVLRAQIVRFILGTGRFDWDDTVATLTVLSIFAASLFAQALILLLARAFYALQDTMTPFVIGLFAAGLNTGLALYAAPRWGVVGLAVAWSVATILNCIGLWVLLRQRLGSLTDRAIFSATGWMILASLIAGGAAEAIKYVIEPLTGTQTFMGVMIQGLAATTAGIGIYGILCWCFNIQELTDLLGAFQRRLRRSPVIIEPIENE